MERVGGAGGGDGVPPGPAGRIDLQGAVAGLAFAGALAAFVLLGPPAASPGAGLASGALFALLVGAYFGLSVRSWRRWLAARVRPGTARALAGPSVLLAAAVLYAAASGLPVLPRLTAYGAYLLLPALLLAREPGPARRPAADLIAAGLLWLPIELDLLPSLPLPAPGGQDVARFLGLASALYLFLVARGLRGVGYDYVLRGRDVRLALAGFAAFAAVALPAGFATGFIEWRPEPSWGRLPLLLGIYLAIAVPEEFLFRGLFQNLLTRPLGPRRSLAAASVVFGLAHLPDARYVLLAAFAGVAYGWVYQRTGKITAAALTHAVVDWVWVVWLGG